MFFEEGNAFSPFPCVHCVRALKSSGSEIFHQTEPSEHLDAIHAAHWREDSSLRGRGFRNTTQLPCCLCFVERTWRAYRPGQRSDVKITAFLFFFLENTKQIEINLSSSQEPRYSPTRLISETTSIAVIPDIILLFLDAPCGEKMFFLYPAGLWINRESGGSELTPAFWSYKNPSHTLSHVKTTHWLLFFTLMSIIYSGRQVHTTTQNTYVRRNALQIRKQCKFKNTNAN